MTNIVIQGGKAISGEYIPVGNKNLIIKLIPASILIDGEIELTNVPQSSALNTILEIFKDLGGHYTLEGDMLKLNSKNISKYEINEELSIKERTSLMFLAPLLSKFGRASISDAGGCKLGNRPLDTLFQGLQMLGAVLDKENGYSLKAEKLKGNKVWQVEASVTGTESLILLAVKTPGITEIYNSASEPHTQDLCNFLNQCGAKISGIGTNRLVIEGVENLKATKFRITPDHIDIGGMIVASAITNGELLIKNARVDRLTNILNNFAKVNLKYQIKGDDLLIPANQQLINLKNIKGDIDKIKDEPWPGLPADLIPQALILSTRAENAMRIYSNMYEVQLIELYAELYKMKLKAIFSNPNLILTFEKTDYKGAKVNASSVLQSTHAMILAGLVAEGKTTISNADNIFRRFPKIVEILKNLGAQIDYE